MELSEVHCWVWLQNEYNVDESGQGKNVHAYNTVLQTVYTKLDH